MALIFAWTGALEETRRAGQDTEVVEFAHKLEQASLETIESGIMTGDLLRVATTKPEKQTSLH